MKRFFTYKYEKSDKFWSVKVSGKTLLVVFGRTNTAGVTKAKEFDNEADAQKEAEKLIREKLKKGYTEVIDGDVGKFSETEFWNMIERSRKNSEDCHSQCELLIEYLSQRPVEDIVTFEDIFRANYAKSYRADLWGAAYLINGGCSDDGFDYFRCWLIAKGKDAFQSALANPDNLSKYIHEDDFNFREYDCEDLLNVGSKSFSKKSVSASKFRKILSVFRVSTKISESKESQLFEEFEEMTTHFPYPEISLDWDFDDDTELKRRFPKLYRKLEKDNL